MKNFNFNVLVFMLIALMLATLFLAWAIGQLRDDVEELEETLIKRTASIGLDIYDLKCDWLVPIYDGCVKNK